MTNTEAEIKVRIEEQLKKLEDSLGEFLVNFNRHNHVVSTFTIPFKNPEPKCGCGARVGKFKQGHASYCDHWVFRELDSTIK